MSEVGTLATEPAHDPPLLNTIEEAAEVLRVGRTLAYALARRYEDTGGLEGLPVIRLGNCMRVPRWALLELALNGRTVALGELIPAAVESRRRLDAERTRISVVGREPEPPTDDANEGAAVVVQRARHVRIHRVSDQQLHPLPPS